MPANVDDPSIRVGGLYTSQYDDGKWHVTKVLAFDGDVVHLRMYANTFPEQPRPVDPASSHWGASEGRTSFGIGHAPIAKEGFLSEKRHLVMVTAVTDDELDGYRYYLDAMREAR